jgi:uncharacterized protein YjiS (DUF1127 family)
MRSVPAISHLATGQNIGRILDRMTRRVAALLAMWRGRQAVAELAHFDARLLRDIGLSRSDVVAAIERPMSEDPTLHLADAVRERRLAHLAQKREAARAWH